MGAVEAAVEVAGAAVVAAAAEERECSGRDSARSDDVEQRLSIPVMIISSDMDSSGSVKR